MEGFQRVRYACAVLAGLSALSFPNTAEATQSLTYEAGIITSWSGGYCARVNITNTGTTVTDHPAAVDFTLSGETTINKSWNGTRTREGENVHVVYPGWVSTIAPGATAGHFGFCVSGTSRPVFGAVTAPEPEAEPVPAEFSALSQVDTAWAEGYCTKIAVTNVGETAARPDAVRFKLPLNTAIASSWNATLSRDGESVEAVYLDWAGVLQPGQTQTHFGFCASGTGAPFDLFAYNETSVAPPTNSTAVGTAMAVATAEGTIEVTAPYGDDENANNGYSVEYKLSYATQWRSWSSASAHAPSPYSGVITSLLPGESYDVRVTYVDTDGVSGINPQIIGGIVLAGGGADANATAAFVRGINLSNNAKSVLRKEDVARWKSWGVETVRIHLDKDDTSSAYIDEPGADDIWAPYAASKARLQERLGWLGEQNITVMVTLDNLWGDDHYSSAMWANGGDNVYLRHRIALAGEAAAWLAGFSNVQYLEVWNEPHPYSDIYRDYFLPAVIEKIRNVNPQIEIVCMAPHDWGLLQGLAAWDGLSGANVTYSTHMYSPWTYTHQGILGNPADAEGWPGMHKDYPTSTLKYHDIAWVRSQVDIIKAFEARSGSKVIVTEFGVVRWAVDADKYIGDLVQAFEEQDVQWIFHSLNGWNGWNPTFAHDREESFEPYGGDETPSLQRLKEAWAK